MTSMAIWSLLRHFHCLESTSSHIRVQLFIPCDLLEIRRWFSRISHWHRISQSVAGVDNVPMARSIATNAVAIVGDDRLDGLFVNDIMSESNSPFINTRRYGRAARNKSVSWTLAGRLDENTTRRTKLIVKFIHFFARSQIHYAHQFTNFMSINHRTNYCLVTIYVCLNFESTLTVCFVLFICWLHHQTLNKKSGHKAIDNWLKSELIGS